MPMDLRKEEWKRCVEARCSHRQVDSVYSEEPPRLSGASGMFEPYAGPLAGDRTPTYFASRLNLYGPAHEESIPVNIGTGNIKISRVRLSIVIRAYIACSEDAP